MNILLFSPRFFPSFSLFCKHPDSNRNIYLLSKTFDSHNIWWFSFSYSWISSNNHKTLHLFNIHNKTWAFHHSLRLLFFLLHIYCFLFSTSFDIGLLQNLWFFRNDKCLNYISYGFFIFDTTLIFILYFKSRTISLQYFILHHYLFSSFSPSSAYTFCIFSLDVWASFEIGYGLFITVIFHTKLIARKDKHALQYTTI